MNEFYNRHYITTDAQGRVISGWSDGPCPDRDASGAVCINEQGGYQFRLAPGGEENPPLYTVDGIALYRWDGERAMCRTDDEIAADRVPPMETVRAAKRQEIGAACSAAIYAGVDVGGVHYSLTEHDQTEIMAQYTTVKEGAAAVPYHADGELCRMYPAEEFAALAQAATAHVFYHRTYCNHVNAWIARAGLEELERVTYGAALPADLAEHMESVLAAAGGDADAL